MASFRAIKRALQREGIIPATCRERSWYRYTHGCGGGMVVERGISKRRAPGQVAQYVIATAGEHGYPVQALGASWAGAYPRTAESIATESEGIVALQRAADWLLQRGLLLSKSDRVAKAQGA